MLNYAFMVTWLPASVSISEKIYFCSRSWFLNFHLFAKPVDAIVRLHSRISDNILEFVIKLVTDYAVLWIGVGLCFGIVSSIYAGFELKLPDTPTFRLFTSTHPFEVYEEKYKELFWFEKMYTSLDSFKMPIRFIWGVLPIDNGNYLNPRSRGSIQLGSI